MMQSRYQQSRQNVSTVHYVESGPSIFSEVPGVVSIRELKVFNCKERNQRLLNFSCRIFHFLLMKLLTSVREFNSSQITLNALKLFMDLLVSTLL